MVCTKVIVRLAPVLRIELCSSAVETCKGVHAHRNLTGPMPREKAGSSDSKVFGAPNNGHVNGVQWLMSFKSQKIIILLNLSPGDVACRLYGSNIAQVGSCRPFSNHRILCYIPLF